MPYFDARKLVQHPVACIDCHDPSTMQLRVTRPAFILGLRALKKNPNYDPNVMATRQEMRSFVCGQCHVEYYLKGPEKALVFPWANGLRGDEILSFYDQVKQNDWTHALKISDHHVRSPLLNVNRACQGCHRWPEEELKAWRRSRRGRSRCAIRPWTR
jgi:nitrite reductase (cytochrome c-552)